MQAVTVAPGTAGSARLDDVPEPSPNLGSVLVEALAVGICGTDEEIARGEYGWAPPGEDRLILGHESLGRVLDPGSSGLSVGDHVVGIVRRPDPAPCPNWNIVVECTGVAQLVLDAANGVSPGGIVCLTGVGSPTQPAAGQTAQLANDAVLKNLVVFGSVNANRRHYYHAAKVLARAERADRSWLEQLITRQVRPDEAARGVTRAADDIKVVVDFAGV